MYITNYILPNNILSNDSALTYSVPIAIHSTQLATQAQDLPFLLADMASESLNNIDYQTNTDQIKVVSYSPPMAEKLGPYNNLLSFTKEINFYKHQRYYSSVNIRNFCSRINIQQMCKANNNLAVHIQFDAVMYNTN